MSDAEKYWRGSTWERVCRDCFGGDEQRMLEHARRYSPKAMFADGDLHLGSRFRDIVKARNRTTWWRRARELLEQRVNRHDAPVVTIDVAAALAALEQGATVRLVRGDALVATLVPAVGEQ
jgi:hypothetical protein